MRRPRRWVRRQKRCSSRCSRRKRPVRCACARRGQRRDVGSPERPRLLRSTTPRLRARTMLQSWALKSPEFTALDRALRRYTAARRSALRGKVDAGRLARSRPRPVARLMIAAGGFVQSLASDPPADVRATVRQRARSMRPEPVREGRRPEAMDGCRLRATSACRSQLGRCTYRTPALSSAPL